MHVKVKHVVCESCSRSGDSNLDVMNHSSTLCRACCAGFEIILCNSLRLRIYCPWGYIEKLGQELSVLTLVPSQVASFLLLKVNFIVFGD
ncbi:hypothetical protein AVEN_89435-1 [Araneus ventricosus]|uniref:Uncharacterized protein n=1 Tax=Araneus ventricosus TaxID=182803 RepID=A0A4Y2NN20_ARAVE|nr:hypothetical protein AVEN_274059-1 [Araneus ventricosus]GBN40925.1 hypothetical protein AVEN_89435-1 [Araneus ventricosus]